MQWTSARSKTILFFGILVVAAWELASGFYIHAKAQVGQWLIAQAWEQTLDQHKPVKPWSWADTYPVGRLVVSDLGIDQFVLAGASGRTLAFGPGHHDESVDPGETGKALLVGHRDTHFAFLKELQPGHELEFQDHTGTWHQFEVDRTVIMNEQEERLVLDGKSPALILVTCYPFHAIVPAGPLRYVVLAKANRNEAREKF